MFNRASSDAPPRDGDVQPCWSPLNIQLLPPHWRRHLGFAGDDNSAQQRRPGTVGRDNGEQQRRLEIARRHLRQHDIPFDGEDKRAAMAVPSVPLVPLLGRDLQEHFWRLGKLASQPHLPLIQQLAAMAVPDIPAAFSDAPGWTRYGSDGTLAAPVEWPSEPAMVFDVEAMLHVSLLPVFAMALGVSGAWYSWTSPLLSSSAPLPLPSLEHLIPLGPADSPQLVVGHNVSFDRGHVREEHALRLNRRRFLDTLSLHSAIAGLSSQQRPLWQAYRKRRNQGLAGGGDVESKDGGRGDCSTSDADPVSIDEEPGDDAVWDNPPADRRSWEDASAMNSLADAYRLHCGRTLDKRVRDELLADRKATTWEPVRTHFQRVAAYCAHDVRATLELLQRLWPIFHGDKGPHPATLAALLQMGSYALPVDGAAWAAYLRRCDDAHANSLSALHAGLRHLAWQKAALPLTERLSDSWLRALDNTPVPAQHCKPRKQPDGTVTAKPKGEPRLFGKPAWFKQLWRKGDVEVTVRAHIVPYLLGMRWRQRPVHFVSGHGWCYSVDDKPPEDTGADGAALPDSDGPQIVVGGRRYKKIPHPEYQDGNVGCLLSKLFLRSPHLSADSALLHELQAALKTFSLWTSYRERLHGQLVLGGVILPATIPMGTVTRRAVEKTWMTATNPKPGIAGSELKTLVRAPPQAAIVGADVDSQELWIASLFGDSQFGEHGGTAVGWMTLQGRRADGSDLHSRTARILDMRRDDAKIFTYGRIYGAGQRYAAQLLLRFSPALTPLDADAKARELYERTKGRKAYGLELAGRGARFAVPDDGGSQRRYLYVGGTESFMFNALELVARADPSRTPVLGAAISDGLRQQHVCGQFMTSRVNWAVQSSAVDYLHLLLVGMEHLCETYAIQARLMLTIHDELRFVCASADALRCALALQVCNLWVRAVFAQRLGFTNLPLGVAFFSAVDVDAVLRKDPAAPCLTATNDCPLEPGQALDIHQLLLQCSSLERDRDGSADGPSAVLFRDIDTGAYGERVRGVLMMKPVLDVPMAPFVLMSPAMLEKQLGLDGASETGDGVKCAAGTAAPSKRPTHRAPSALTLREMAEENIQRGRRKDVSSHGGTACNGAS